MASDSLIHGRRIDIDLLRALAVLAVMLFHFNVSGFDGGFVGVDIFFVISGYLISRQLFRLIENESFSYIAFFARRARRLVPALAFTIVAVWIASLFLATPSVFIRTLKEAVYSITYLSNFLFWAESGYFDSAANTKPLLHTWSLSVEEQFYVVWPLVLLALAGHAKNKGIWLLTLAGLSLAACEVVLTVDPSAAFFLFPFRIFEFAIGAYVAQIPHRSGRRNRNVIGLAALTVVIGSVLLLDEDTRFPGVSVLPLCIAVAALIHVRAGWMNPVNFFTRAGCWIGRVSYSAYLAHWPLVVFYTGRGHEIDGWSSLVLVIATLAIAQVMRRYVELPFLTMPTRRFTMAIPLTAVVVLAVIPLSMPLYSSLNAGRKNLDDLIVQLESRKDLVRRLIDETRDRPGGELKVVVTGDSHAVDLMLGLKLVAPEFMDIHLVRALCDPLVHEFTNRELEILYDGHPSRNATPDKCREVHATTLLEKYVAAAPDVILYSDQWRSQALPYLRETIDRVSAATGARIVILGRNQEFELTPDRMLELVENDFEINETAWRQRIDHGDLNEALRDIAIEVGTVFIEKEDLVCKARGSCDYLVDDNLSFIDTNHWSETGMRLFSRRLIDKLEADGVIIEP